MKKTYKRSKHRCVCSSCELKNDSRKCTEELIQKLNNIHHNSLCLLPIDFKNEKQSEPVRSGCEFLLFRTIYSKDRLEKNLHIQELNPEKIPSVCS